MKFKQAFIVSLLGLLLGLNFYFFIGGEGLTVERALAKLFGLAAYTEDYFWSAVIIFLGVRFFFSVISIPGSGVLTVAGGAIFGLWMGTMLTLIAVVSGISIAFVLSRYGWRQLGANRFTGKLYRSERSYAGLGAGVLLALRLTGFVPAFLVNSAFAVTPMKFNTYFIISLPAVLPGIILFSALGACLGEVPLINT